MNDSVQANEDAPAAAGPVGRYELIDFGQGRKLESLAGYLVDRPSPVAERTRRGVPQRWAEADARFDAVKGIWEFRRPFPTCLRIDCDRFVMPVNPTPSGHLGLFPEQRANWRWLDEQARALAASKRPGMPRLRRSESSPLQSVDDHAVRALNLFAYTGASTLALAAAGCQVAHVDAAKPNVAAAKLAAAASGMHDHPIRFLVDDARKLIQRELRRGNRYDIVVLDPPAYGHGPRGKAWRLERDLWPLLEDCLRLLGRGEEPRDGSQHSRAACLLVTGHSEAVGPAQVNDWLRSTAGDSLQVSSGRSQIRDPRGRRLDAGFFVRASWD